MKKLGRCSNWGCGKQATHEVVFPRGVIGEYCDFHYATYAKRMEVSPEIKKEFIYLQMALEPENLTCDGELSKREIDKRRTELKRKWNDIEEKIGRSVSEDEVLKWWMEKILK